MRLLHIIRGHIHKNSHLVFYLKGLWRQFLPDAFCLMRLRNRLSALKKCSEEERRYILDRVNFYCHLEAPITLSDGAYPLSRFTMEKKNREVTGKINSTYFYDCMEYTRFFPKRLKWMMLSGDVSHTLPQPGFTKSRPILPPEEPNNNILLNMDKVRHFLWIKDPIAWEEKQTRILFRGDVNGKPHRERFLEMWQHHPLCDLQAGGGLTLYDHLKYRYIMSLEGNDVASNLKWVMSSNSVAVMPRPKYETWFMESRLRPNYHYIEIRPDYSDLIERIEYFERHPEEAKAIAAHAHEWVKQFWNQEREDLISLLVLEKYFKGTGQLLYT